MESKFEKVEAGEQKGSKTLSAQELGETVAKNLLTEGKIPSISDLQHLLRSSLLHENPDYEKAIFLLMELRDREQNIFWRVDKAQREKTGRDLIIRDAREVKQNPVIDKYAYLIQGFNHIRGALLLLGDKQSQHKFVYDSLLRHFIINVTDTKPENSEKEFKHFNAVIIQSLSHHLNLPTTVIAEQLAVSREFANLESEARDVATINKLQDNDNNSVIAVQAEIALTELTPDLKKKYENRANETWYKKLPAWQQKLVELEVENILQGNRIIPTQLRKVLIGSRNAYVNVSGIINDKGEFLNANTNPHSGTIAYYGKDKEVNQEIANLHAAQLKHLYNVNHLVTLNSPSNPTGDDKKIVEESSKAMQYIDGFYSNLPLNWLRRVTPNIYSGIYHLLDEVSAKLVIELFNKIDAQEIPHSSLLYVAIQQYLDASQEEFDLDERDVLNLIGNELSKLKNEFANDSETLKTIDLINLAVKISYLTRHNVVLDDENNQNLFIAALANILDSQLANMFKEKHNRTSSACQSGKDRDGILIFTIDLLHFLHYINGIYQVGGDNLQQTASNRQNTIALALGGHAQFMAGFLGSTLGAFGIKKDSIGAIPVALFPPEVAMILVLPTAQLNKEISIDEKQPLEQQIYYVSDLLEFTTQMAVIKNALEIQIATQRNKAAPISLTSVISIFKKDSDVSKFFSNMSANSQISSFQLQQLKELLDDLEKILDSNKINQEKLEALIDKVSSTLNFLQTRVEDSFFAKPGVTIKLLASIKVHLDHLRTLQTPRTHLDSGNFPNS